MPVKFIFVSWGKFHSLRQVNNLRMEVDSANGKREALQKSLDDLRRQLTAKESELTEAGNLQVVPK